MAEKSCKRCGQCCDQFPMSESQIERIEKYLEENPDIKNLLRNTPEIIAPPRRVCPFLRGEVGNAYCTIYPVRPEICKVFGVKGYIEGLKIIPIKYQNICYLKRNKLMELGQ